MSASDDAQAHLAKPKEYLDAANDALHRGYLNAATSNAVTSDINSKDAICLGFTLKVLQPPKDR